MRNDAYSPSHLTVRRNRNDMTTNVAGMIFGLWDRLSAVTGILTIPIAV
jgi:hypothetical protein